MWITARCQAVSAEASVTAGLERGNLAVNAAARKLQLAQMHHIGTHIQSGGLQQTAVVGVLEKALKLLQIGHIGLERAGRITLFGLDIVDELLFKIHETRSIGLSKLKTFSISRAQKPKVVSPPTERLAFGVLFP